MTDGEMLSLPSNLRTHLLYQFILRTFISIVSTSYVHPDEYFQSMEVVNKLYFGFDTFIPWEFQSDHAIRTIVTPVLVTGIPYFIGSIFHLVHNGWYLLISPKIVLVLLSLTIDIIGFKIHQKYVVSKANSGQMLLFLFSTSW